MSECIIYKGSINKQGYGVYGKKHRLAHRIAYENHHGSIPKGMTIDHLCCNRTCVNPDHLECVTLSENVKRMHSRSPWGRIKQ